MKLAFDPNQPLITDYTSIVSKVQDILQNAEMQTPAEEFYEDVESIQKEIPADFHEVESKPSLSTELFKKLMVNAQKNCSMIPQGRRHNEIMKKFSLSLLLMTGSCAYKLIHTNMPEAFP